MSEEPDVLAFLLVLLYPRIVKYGKFRLSLIALSSGCHKVYSKADASDEAMVLRDQISSQFDCAKLFITKFTPVMGTHIGPGFIGVAFYDEDFNNLFIITTGYLAKEGETFYNQGCGTYPT